MEHVGLKNVDIAPSVCQILSTALYKTKFLSFDLPEDCEVISDGLANTTVLQQHDLCIESDPANRNILSALRQKHNIKILKLDYCFFKLWIPEILKLLECSRLCRIDHRMQ